MELSKILYESITLLGCLGWFVIFGFGLLAIFGF